MRSHYIVCSLFLVFVASACTQVPSLPIGDRSAAPITATPAVAPTLNNPNPEPANTPPVVAFPTAAASRPTIPAATVTVSPATAAAARRGVGGPVVQVVSPLTNTQISVNQTIYVVAFAATDGTLARIEMADDGVSVHSENVPAVSTFAAVMPWTPAQTGGHILRVFAVDTNNIAGTPEEVSVTVTPDQRKPIANILYPVGIPQVELGSVLQVYAAGSDETGVTQLDLWVDKQLYTYEVVSASPSTPQPSTPQAGGALAGVLPAQPNFSAVFAWNALAPGNHTLVVRAHDTQDQTTDSAPLNVFVVDTHAPAISASFDRTNVQAGEVVSVTITALDVSGIQRVELWTSKEISSTFTSGSAARQTSLSVQYAWQSGTAGDFPLYARAYNTNGDAKDSPVQIISVLRPGQATPTRAPQPTPTRTRTPRPPPTARLQPPAPPSVEITAPSDRFSNQFPVRIAFNARGNSELDRVELWGYMQDQPSPQVICSVEARATTQKVGQCDWSPPTVGPAYIYAQVFDAFHQTGRSATISGIIGVPALPTPTPTPVPLAGRWTSTAQGGQSSIVFRPIVTGSGTALRGDYRTTTGGSSVPQTGSPTSPVTVTSSAGTPSPAVSPTGGTVTTGAELVGRITSGSVKGDRLTFRIEFTPVIPATPTPAPETPTLTPAPTPTPLAPALDFDCGVDSSGNTLNCTIKDARGVTTTATFKRDAGP